MFRNIFNKIPERILIFYKGSFEDSVSWYIFERLDWHDGYKQQVIGVIE